MKYQLSSLHIVFCGVRRCPAAIWRTGYLSKKVQIEYVYMISHSGYTARASAVTIGS